MQPDPASAAPSLPVLYRSVKPVSAERHAALRLRALAEPLSFARGTHLLPAVFEEFAAAAREIPIVFLPEGNAMSAVFLLSMRSGHNSFVTDEGLWTASYLPGYIRRYPFIAADVEGAEPILCLDEGFAGLGESEGEALFADGAPSALLRQAMAFAAGYREASQRSAAAIRRLGELGLFKPINIDVTSAAKGNATILGLCVVDEEKLRALPDDVTIELQRSGILPAVYAHLLSLGGIAKLG